MHEKHKEEQQKPPTKDEPKDVSPPGSSFDTEAGREAQGMRKDLGGNPEEPPDDDEHANDEARMTNDESNPKHE